MTLSWVLDHDAWRGFTGDNRLVGAVVEYGAPAGFVGFVRGYRVAGRWESAELAQAAVESVAS